MATYKISIVMNGGPPEIEVFEEKEAEPFAAHPNMAPVRRTTPGYKNRASSVTLSERGRLALSVFKTIPLARHVDFIEVFMKRGYSASTPASVLSELEKEGTIVRAKRGVYRLPLPRELRAVETKSA